MTRSGYELAETLRRHDVPGDLIERLLRLVEPVLQRAATGSLNAADATPPPDTQAIAAAIAAATGCTVKAVRLQLAPKPFADFTEPDAPFVYGPELNFNDSLAVRLWLAHRQRLGRQTEERYGWFGRGPYADSIGLFLRRAIGEPCGFRFHDGFSCIPTNPAGESVCSALYWCIAYAGIGDLAAVAELEPLVGLLTSAVPIARLTADRGTWIVAQLGEAPTEIQKTAS